MDMYIVKTEKVIKKYGSFLAVNKIDMKVRSGKIYGLLGPNGAGKSTMLRMLLGLIKPNSGKIEIFNKNINKDREKVLEHTGALIEAPSYYGDLTAFENLDIIKRMLKLNITDINNALKAVNLMSVKDKKVNEFSLGMKQRLGIAQAIIGNPKLLILDEPTNGLDPAGIIEIRNLIKKLSKEKGMTIIVSSHILSEIEIITDDVGIIKNGTLIYQGAIEGLKNINNNKVIVEIENFEQIGFKLINELKRIGYKVKDDNNYIVIEGNDVYPSKIARKIINWGYDINYLSNDKKSLEDIFLEITGEKNYDVNAN